MSPFTNNGRIEFDAPRPRGELFLIEMRPEGAYIARLSPAILEDLITCAIMAELLGLELAELPVILEARPPEGETGAEAN